MAYSHPKRLVYLLRSVFNVTRWLILISLSLTALIAFFAPHPEYSALLGFAEVHFAPASLPLAISRDPSVKGELYLARLSGQLSLRNATESDELLRLARWSHVASVLIPGLLVFFILDLLWQLCRNVEQGEVFTRRNAQLVRRLGGAVVALALIGSAAESWKAYRIENYLQQHVTFTGIQTQASASPQTGLGAFNDAAVRNLHVDLSLLATGLLVLALAEVFRQGVALKQEADLTV